MNEFFNWILATVHGVDPTLRVFLAGIAMLFETSILLGLIVPGDSVVLVAATAVSGPVEFISLAVAVIVGSLAGESIGFWLGQDRKSTRLNSSHRALSRMPSSA